MALASATLCALAVVALLFVEFRASHLGKWLTKPIASLGFLGIALSRLAHDALPYPRLLLALGLCMLGDVLLIPKRRATFAVGLLAFMGGHLSYASIYVARGIDLRTLSLAVAPLLVSGALLLRWLWGPLSERQPRLRLPVLLYIGVISGMFCCALGTWGAARADGLLLGAAMVFLSDLFVARNRFVSPGFMNRLFGLPLYYAGQCLLAWTV